MFSLRISRSRRVQRSRAREPSHARIANWNGQQFEKNPKDFAFSSLRFSVFRTSGTSALSDSPERVRCAAMETWQATAKAVTRGGPWPRSVRVAHSLRLFAIDCELAHAPQSLASASPSAHADRVLQGAPTLSKDCWRLDRLGRNLRHLILLLDELRGLGVAFVTLGEGLDTSTPAGRLQLHILSAIAEFERSRLQERVIAGLARARAQGQRLGRPEREISSEQFAAVRGLPVREAARRLGIPRSTLQRALARIPPEPTL